MVDFKTSNVVARMNDPGFCYILAAVDTLNFRDSRHAPAYNDYSRVYAESIDESLRETGCASAKMGNALGLRRGELLRWRREPPRGFPVYMQVALVAAVENRSPGADQAWERFRARVNPDNPSKSPEWSLVPR